MLDKLKAKMFPCAEKLRQVRAEHSSAARCNESAHEELKRVCINALYPQFSHMEGKGIVNPR